MKLSEVTFDGTLEELEDLINFLKNVQEEHTKVVKKTDICHSHFRDWSDKWNKEDSDFIVVTRFWNNNESIRQQFTSSDNITEEEIAAYTEKMAEVKKLAKYKVQDEKKDEDGNYTVSVKVEPSDVFQTLQQSSAEVSKEKIVQGMKETDPGVFASVLTESVQKSIDKNSYGDSVTVTVKVEKNHSGTYEMSETEGSKLETAMFPTE